MKDSTLFNIKRNVQITRTILVITFLYIFATLPSILQTGYFYTNIISLEAGTLIVSAINALEFSYPALNFFILFFSNKMFADEVKAFFNFFNKKLADLRCKKIKPRRVRVRHMNINNRTILDKDFR